MSDPVAVPINTTLEQTPKFGASKSENSQMLDEGLDHESYIGTYGSPFIADYLGIRDLYKSDPTGSVKSMVDQVTSYAFDEVEQPMIFAMKDLFTRMEQELNLHNSDAGLYRLKQIHKLMTAKQRIKSLEAAQQQAIEDIRKML